VAVFVREGTPLFVNCLFHNNKAWEGGVVIVVEGLPTFVNCTMANNQSTIGYGRAIFDPDGRVTLKNCILWGNTTTRGVGYPDQISRGSGGATLASYSDIQGGWPGTGNINADPQFVNAAAGDYKLQITSPCKNVGENAGLPPDSGDLDWDTNTVEPTPKNLARLPRIRLGTVDMGAYEIQTEAE
jgi:hypothetical protein